MTPEAPISSAPLSDVRFGLAPTPKETMLKAHGQVTAAFNEFDHLALAQVINSGVQALGKGQLDEEWGKAAHKILSDMEEQFEQRGKITKLFVPDQNIGIVEASDLREAGRIAGEFRRIFPDSGSETFGPPPGVMQSGTNKMTAEVIRRAFPNVADYMIHFSLFARDFLDTDHPGQGLATYTSLHVRMKEEAAVGGRTDLRAAKIAAMHEDETLRRAICIFDPGQATQFRNPDDFALFIQNADRNNPFESDHLWEKKFGGDSLARIFSEPVASADKFGNRILSYCAGLPKGDFLYQRLAEDMFFTPAMTANPDGYGMGGTGSVSARVLLFQEWLTDKLLSPELGGEPAGGTDQNFVNATNRLTPAGQYQLARLLTDPISSDEFSRLARNGLRNMYSHPDGVAGGLPTTGNLDRFLPEPGTVHHPFYEEQTMRTAYEFRDLIRKKMPEITASWDRRFKADTTLRHTLRTLVEPAFEHDEAATQRELFAESIQEWGGDIFYRHLQDNHGQLADINRSLWDDIGRNCSYYPAEGTVHTIRFSPGSLPEVLGFRTLELVVGLPDPGKGPGTVEYRITTKENEFPITGSFSGSPERPETAGDPPDVREAVKFADLVALAGLRDLESRVAIERSAGAERVNLGDAASGGEGTGETPKTKRKRNPHESQLPLVHRIFTGTADATLENDAGIPSGELVERIQRETKGYVFKPRSVGTYPRRLPGSAVFERHLSELGDQYRMAIATGDEPSAKRLKGEIEQLTGSFATHAHHDFPASFMEKFDRTTDPVTGETIYLSTQVSGYHSPKLSEEERRNVHTLYARRYKGQDAALRFLDVLMERWMTSGEDANNPAVPSAS